MKSVKTVMAMLLLAVVLTGCGKEETVKEKPKDTPKENIEVTEEQSTSDETDITKVENPNADEWYVKNIEAYNEQSVKEVVAYDVVNGEEMEDASITYHIDKEKKTISKKVAEGKEESLEATDENLNLGDIDLTYVTGYEVMGEEEMDGKKMIVVKMTEEGYLTAAEEAENEMGDELQEALSKSEELQKAYDICLGEQMREKYVWFDAETKTPQWVETDITKDQMFRDMLDGIIAEVPEEDIQTVRVMECTSEKSEKADEEKKSDGEEELPGEPLVIETEEK